MKLLLGFHQGILNVCGLHLDQSLNLPNPQVSCSHFNPWSIIAVKEAPQVKHSAQCLACRDIKNVGFLPFFLSNLVLQKSCLPPSQSLFFFLLTWTCSYS